MTEKPSFFRRTLVVDKRSQYAFLLYTLLVSIVLIGFNVAISWMLHGLFDSSDGYPGISRDKIVAAMALAALGSGCMIVICITGALYVSNKVAGPVWRLNQSMKAVLEGAERKKLVFRKGDHFQEVAVTYNQLLEMIERLEKNGKS